MERMPERKAVWVYAQTNGGKLCPVVYELLSEGRRLADERKGKLCAVLLGWKIKELSETLLAWGADVVYLGEHPLLEQYSAEGYEKVMAALIGEKKPEIILIGGTDQGRDLAPRVAAGVKTGLTVDCTDLRIDPDSGRLCQIRPVFGNSMLAEIYTKSNLTQMCTLRPGMFEGRTGMRKNAGKICRINIALKASEIRTEMIKSDYIESANHSLLSADIVIGGGLGVGSREGFVFLEQMAAEIGAAVGGTRAAVGKGFISRDKMIGQTGLIIAPRIYIACGISGAVQHMLGVSKARYVVAVNHHPQVPIFEEADFGVVADYRVFLPKLIEQLKRKDTV